MSKAKQIPAVEGLFTWSDTGANLIGSKCTSCNTCYFPKGLSCKNPDCQEKKVENYTFSRRGKLFSYTEVYYPPPLPFKMPEPFTPYRLGVVELAEGNRVVALLTDCKLEDLKIGMSMEMVVEKLVEDEQGNELVTYKFRPVKSSGGAK
ncbi:MAG: OB-fold domain-containing protein [Chloroflexota bacterium]